MKPRSLLLALALAALGCGDDGAPNARPTELTSTPPSGFPAMRIPADNPFTREKAELGRYLFYDRKLSGNQTQSCGSCHRQSLAFTDGRAVSTGSTGDHTPRGAMSLVNVGYAVTLTWANPSVRQLERQALVPMFGERPVELGLAGMEAAMLARLRADARYPAMFRAAFPGQGDPVTLDNVTKAIATFERAILSADSPYDRYQRGDHTALSASAKRGMDLYFGERLECFHCHGGFNLTDAVVTAATRIEETPFHNTGLYNLDGMGAYPAENTGIYDITHSASDMGRFRAPTLRNIAVTAPYMHDGSVATLEGAIDHYAAGGRTIASGPNAGVGSASPLRSEFVRGFILDPREKADVVEFLRALTDESLLRDPRFADPFGNEH
ncbi:MAG: di-heme enzyme [Polyangiales bacterium]